MKRSFAVFFAVWGMLCVSAQQVKRSISGNIAEKSLTIYVENAGFSIVGHSGPELVMECYNYPKAPARAEGLRPLYNQSVDNTGIGLEYEESGNTLVIKRASGKQVDYTIKVPQTMHLIVKNESPFGGDVEVQGITGEIEISSSFQDVNLQGISGPVVLNSISANLTVAYSAYAGKQPSHISTVSGEIDVSLPESSKARLEMHTVTGEMYSNFNLSLPKREDGLTHIGGDKKIESNLNGGGPQLSLSTVSGNIYLRKK